MSSPDRLQNTLLGVALLYLSMWVLSTLDASGKWLLTAGIPLISVVWMRYLSHVILMSCLIIPRHGPKILHSRAWKLQLARAALMLMASLCLFGALHYLPQAQTTAIAFLAPLLMLALAPWLLQEPQKRSRWIAAGVGFLGVMIVIRPSAGLHPIGVMLALGAALSLALQHVYTRRLSVDHPMTTLFWSGLFGTIVMSFVLVSKLSLHLQALSDLSALQWVVMISLGLSGGIGQLLQIQAYQHAPASVLAPCIYLQITAATALGWLIWGDFPDAMTWVGIGIICSSGIAITLYEWHSRRLSKPAIE